MDGSRFDAFARALGQGTSRRKVLRGLAGAFAGGALARHGVEAAGRNLVICHATGNPNAPWQSMTIPQAQFNQHARHGDFVRVQCCSDSECPNQYGDCGSAVCQNGYCVQLPVPSGTSCDDGLICTTNGICDGAFTCAGSPVVCVETENPCTTSVCSERGGGCQEVPIGDGASCAASDACVDYVCASGRCVATPKTNCTGNCADCGGMCVDLNADPDNCQSCGFACAGDTECTIATCNGGSCGTAATNEGGDCTAESGYDGMCVSGVCHETCPTDASCRFDHGTYENAIGICANGECTCKPNDVPGMCDCGIIADSVAGCCSHTCDCPTRTCVAY